MIHARKDYNRVQDPALENPELFGEGITPIAADEPVFLLRAKDKHFQAMLGFYNTLLLRDSEMDWKQFAVLCKSIQNHIILAKEWQERNGTETPDMPPRLNSK